MRLMRLLCLIAVCIPFAVILSGCKSDASTYIPQDDDPPEIRGLVGVWEHIVLDDDENEVRTVYSFNWNDEISYGYGSEEYFCKDVLTGKFSFTWVLNNDIIVTSNYVDVFDIESPITPPVIIFEIVDDEVLTLTFQGMGQGSLILTRVE